MLVIAVEHNSCKKEKTNESNRQKTGEVTRRIRWNK